MTFDHLVRAICGRLSLRDPQAESLRKLLIPHDAVAVNATLNALASRYDW